MRTMRGSILTKDGKIGSKDKIGFLEFYRKKCFFSANENEFNEGKKNGNEYKKINKLFRV